MPTPDFTKMVPGFDFLQGLMKGAGSALPSMSQWIAPTLDAEEVDKRIQELRTVQFWLEQNAKMLGATIQALEVQRMTLATLKTMNLPVADLRESLKIDPQAYLPKAAKVTKAAPDDEAEDDSDDDAGVAPAPAPAPAPKARSSSKPAAPAQAPTGGAIDPMQWWGALTRQFTELASNALKDSPVEAATQMAGAAFKQAVQPMADAAKAVVGAAAPKPAARKAPARKVVAKKAATRRSR